MREYVPPGHRRFVAALEDGPDVHGFVAADDDDRLRESYDACIDRLIAFRELHDEYAETDVLDQIGDEEGTGGTPYVQFLGNLIDDTRTERNRNEFVSFGARSSATLSGGMLCVLGRVHREATAWPHTSGFGAAWVDRT